MFHYLNKKCSYIPKHANNTCLPIVYVQSLNQIESIDFQNNFANILHLTIKYQKIQTHEWNIFQLGTYLKSFKQSFKKLTKFLANLKQLITV